MTLEVEEYRSLRINTSRVDPDDALLLHMEHDTPILLRFVQEQGRCLRRWRYDRRAMLLGDADQFQHIINGTVFGSSPDRHTLGTPETATVSAYTDIHVRLDEPLVFYVEASWSQSKPREAIRHRIGVFESCSGLVRSGSATKISARI